MPMTLNGDTGIDISGNLSGNGDLISNRITNGNSNVSLAANANIGFSATGNANVFLTTAANLTVNGNLNLGSGYNLVSGGNKVITWVDVTPGTNEFSFTGTQTITVTLNPSTIPAAARYVLCDIFVTCPQTDHFNNVFARESLTAQKNWVDVRGQQPSTQFGTLTRQSVTLTYHGDVEAFSPNYGIWFCSQQIPCSGRTVYYNNNGINGSNTGWVYILTKAYSL